MRKMLGWLPCRIRCRHDSSRSATPFTTRASRPGFKIKHALALRWMRHVPGSLPPKRRPSQSHARLPARRRSARNQAHRRGRSFQPAVCQRRTRKGALRRSLLAMRFNLATGHFLQDALSAPKMVVRGMIGPTSKEQANADEVKELIDRARMAASQNTPSPEKEA